MKTGTLCRKLLLSLCTAVAVLARGAAPPPAIETLDEAVIPGEQNRERQRGPLRTVETPYRVGVVRDVNGFTRIQVTLWGITQPEVRFRRASGARQLAPAGASRPPGRNARLSGNRLIAVGSNSLTTVSLILGASVTEADGLPASIPFGPHASLVNLDYVRLRETRGETSISVIYGIHPQTRRCMGMFALLDDALDGANRFVLLGDSLAECQRAERSRNEGDLLFAEGIPDGLRRAVQEVYGPIAVGFANRLGSEPGQLFVAWWPESPLQGVRFERSWNRNSLLLFNGDGWQQELGPQQREALRAMFSAEQVQRRFSQSAWQGTFTDSAANYLLLLFTSEQAGNVNGQLTDALPGWITGCAGHLRERAGTMASDGEPPSLECGLVVQFVYDAVARARSAGRNNLYDTWRRLLNESYRRGESGAKSATFLASSSEARRIVQGLLDGSVDWARFAADLDRFGARLRISQGASGPAVSVLALMHFQNRQPD